MPADLIRISRVTNGFVISSRREGTVSQTYSYTDRAVAKSVAEVCSELKRLLEVGGRSLAIDRSDSR